MGLCVTACYFDNELDLYGDVICNTEAVTYAEDIQPIIVARCATSGCHTAGGTGNGNFDTYSGLFQKVQNNSFENRVLIQRNMPPNGFLNDCEIETLQQWLNEGAPNN